MRVEAHLDLDRDPNRDTKCLEMRFRGSHKAIAARGETAQLERCQKEWQRTWHIQLQTAARNSNSKIAERRVGYERDATRLSCVPGCWKVASDNSQRLTSD